MAAVNFASLFDLPNRSVASVDGDPIPSLLIIPFGNRTKQEKNAILEQGKPMPHLDIFKKNKPKNRKGSKGKSKCAKSRLSWCYNKFDWLSGSIINEALYCWPCLLYSEENIWTLGAEIDSENLTKVLKAHELADSHKHCLASFRNARTMLVRSFFDEVMTAAAIKHNDKVKRNRELLTGLIDIVMMLYEQDFLLQYVDSNVKMKLLFQFITQHDSNGLIKHCSDLGSKFVNLMNWFCMDMLNCIQLELQYCVSADLIDSDTHSFWSLQVDCMNNMKEGKQHVSLMVRYIDTNGDLQENHLGFYVKNRPILAKNLFEYLISSTSEIADIGYLVAQSYDGGCILVDDLLPLYNRVLSTSPGAVLVPSTDHSLNIVLLQGVLNSCDIKQFVFVLQDFLLPENNLFLYKLLKFPESELKHLKLNSQLLTHILNERNNFVTSYKEQTSVMHATGAMLVKVDYFYRNLQDVKFTSLLLLFTEIFIIAEELSDVFAKNCTDLKVSLYSANHAVTRIKQISREQLISDSYFCVTGSRMFDSKDKEHLQLVTLLNSIIKIIIKQLVARYENSYGKLTFLSLVDSKQFESHNIKFPDKALRSLEHFYGDHFKIDWLKNELKLFIYSDKQFYSLTPLDIIKLLTKNKMTEFLPESYKLFCLVATLPIWPRDTSKSSCIERTIKFFKESRSSTHEVVRSQLSNVFIDKPTVLQLASMDSWHCDIIERFDNEMNDCELELEFEF